MYRFLTRIAAELLCGVFAATSFAVIVPHTAHADEALPASLCALIVGRVICYDGQTGTPTPVTPLNDPVTDFSPSPDGLWLAYRAGLPGDTDEPLYLTPIGSHGQAFVAGTSTVLDPHATPPADLRLNVETLAWAPDGVALAYVTAFGLRVSVPTGIANITDQAYVGLHWSPDGNQIAAQTANGGWVFFNVDQPLTGGVTLRVTRRFVQSAEIAWMDIHTVIVAPISGGLLRFDPTGSSAPVLTATDEHFIRLAPGVPGEVIAIHIAAGDPYGSAVRIDTDGNWSAFGTAKLDPQLTWGPSPGNLLVYITSGTPIMVERATGSEDMLPINHADRIVWRYGDLPQAQGIAMDADLYFIAPDSFGIAQVWRLPRDGFPLIQLTNSPAPVNSYQIGIDTIRYTAGNGGSVLYAGLNGINNQTPTPLPSHAPSTIPRVILTPTQNATRSANATIIAATRIPFVTVTPNTVSSSAYQIQSVGWQPGPLVVRRIKLPSTGSGVSSRAYAIEQPLLSPSAVFAAGFRTDQLIILNWDTGQEVAVQGIQSPRQLQWVS